MSTNDSFTGTEGNGVQITITVPGTAGSAGEPHNALINVSFYGPLCKSAVLRRLYGAATGPHQIEMLSCIHDSRNSMLVVNRGAADIVCTMELMCSDKNCSDTIDHGQKPLQQTGYAYAQDSIGGNFSIQRYLFSTGTSPNDDKVGITIILQEGVGPTTGDVIVL